MAQRTDDFLIIWSGSMPHSPFGNGGKGELLPAREGGSCHGLVRVPPEDCDTVDGDEDEAYA